MTPSNYIVKWMRTESFVNSSYHIVDGSWVAMCTSQQMPYLNITRWKTYGHLVVIGRIVQLTSYNSFQHILRYTFTCVYLFSYIVYLFSNISHQRDGYRACQIWIHVGLLLYFIGTTLWSVWQPRIYIYRIQRNKRTYSNKRTPLFFGRILD